MASQAKKVPLKSEIDLARAAAAPLSTREQLLRGATKTGGYQFYKGFRTAVPAALNVARGLFPASSTTKDQIAKIIDGACIKAHNELDNNLHLGNGLYDYAVAHNVVGAEITVDAISLGRAGRRFFCDPIVLKIDGNKYIPFIDPRLPGKGLTHDARRLVFSIQHTHIRMANPTEWGDVGFVILQFAESKNGTRKVIAHFDAGVEFWDDKQIARMIDDTYRLLDDLQKAA
jgi:hypothetical protein